MTTFYDFLISKSLPVESASDEGSVQFQTGIVLSENQAAVFADAVLEYFRPSDFAVIVSVRNRLNAAKTTADDIPNWASWSQQDWATYRDANVSAALINAIGSLADAKVILLKMAVVLDSLAKMEIALRDQIWPDLPEG